MGKVADIAITERLEAAVQEHERRAAAGERVDLESFCAGYPELAPELRRELTMHALLGELTARPVLEQIGAALGGYQLVEEIGRGGMGAVFRARDLTLDRDVAVKVVAIDPLRPERAERLLREARAIARIRHPHVVEVHGFERTDRWLYLVMELLAGTLAERIAVRADAPARAEHLATIRRWMTEAADGIAHCHAHNIVHRDLKPENLLVDEHDAVKVADFGLARADDLARVTETGHVLGTLGYAAPELLRGETADVRTDVYGLGACLFALLAGRPPGREPAPWRSLPAATPRDLRRVVARAMADDPADRFADATAFARALAAEVAPPARRRTAALLGVGALGVGALAVAGAVVWPGVERAPRPAPATVAVPTGDDAAPAASGFILAEYERWLGENQPPAAAARAAGAAASPTSALWEQKLAELSTGRELSRARAVEFEDGGRTYVAEVDTATDHVEVVLESERVVRARLRLPIEVLAGHTDGWGIYFETTDEDGDGHKELVLVRIGEDLASIRVIKWDPQAWIGGDTGWRRSPPPGHRYGEPTIRDGARVEALQRRTGQLDLAGFALDTGARAAPTRALSWLRPAAPRLLGGDRDLWLEVGHADALVLRDDAASWRWRSNPGATPASWRTVRIGAGGPWVAVGSAEGDVALAGLRPDAVATATAEEHVRRLLGAAPVGVSAREVAGGERSALCAAAGRVVACVAPPAEGDAPRLLWQLRLPAGAEVVQPPVELADLDGDGLGELAIASEDGRLFLISARDGGTIVAAHPLEPRPVAPLLWLESLGCVVVVGAATIVCATVGPDRIESRTIAEVEYRYDVFASARAIRWPRAAAAPPLLIVTIDYGRNRGVQILDPAAAPGSDARLWRYATAADLLPDVATAERDGRLWLAFADVAGALYALPAPLP